MNDQMYKKASELSTTRKLVSIFDDSQDTAKFCVGFIQSIDETDIIIQHVAPNGFYDGYILKKTAKIFQISYDGDYENKICKLYNTQSKKHQLFASSEKNLVACFLKYANQNNLIISLSLFDSGIADIRGYVLGISEDNLIVNQISDYGKIDGTTNLDMHCVTRIDCDTSDEQALKILSALIDK